MSVSKPEYDVYALLYGSHVERQHADNFISPPNSISVPKALYFYAWLILGHGRKVMVDTGFSFEVGARRSRQVDVQPVDLLLRFGLQPDDITDLIISHMHYDHAGNLARYPNARLHVQARELEFCTGPLMQHRALNKSYELGDIQYLLECLWKGRVHFIEGDAQVLPGVDLVLNGGHTAGLQYVKVATARGDIVLASDAIHFYDHLISHTPFPIVHDVGLMLDGYRRIRETVADITHIVPGHDPAVAALFPCMGDEKRILSLHHAPRDDIDQYVSSGGRPHA